MTTPRIGDTVHYTDANRRCFAAIITYVLGPTDARRDLALGADGHVHLAVFGSLELQDKSNIPADPQGPITVRSASGETVISHGNWTSGTWHHIH